MTPATIIEQAQEDGVTLALSPAGGIKAVGNGEAVNRWLPVIREHKAELLDELRSANAVPDPTSPKTVPLPDPAIEAELLALVDQVATCHGFTEMEREEAAAIALSDPLSALECFRTLAAGLPTKDLH